MFMMLFLFWNSSRFSLCLVYIKFCFVFLTKVIFDRSKILVLFSSCLNCVCVCVSVSVSMSVSPSFPTLCDPLDCSLPFPASYVHGKNTGMSRHFLLQGIFLTQGWNPGLLPLLHGQADSLPLHHLGSTVVYFITKKMWLKQKSLFYFYFPLTVEGKKQNKTKQKPWVFEKLGEFLDQGQQDLNLGL